MGEADDGVLYIPSSDEWCVRSGLPPRGMFALEAHSLAR